MLVRLLSLLAALATLAGLADAATAKPKPATLRIAAPAAGKVDLALATVKKGAKLKVKKAPRGVGVNGGVGADGSLVVAVSAKAGKKPRGAVVLQVRNGGKPKNLRIVRDALGAGALPAGACAQVASLLGRSLRGGDPSLARRIADARCKTAAPLAPKVATKPGTTSLSRTGGGSIARPGAGSGAKPAPGGGGGDDGSAGTPACANGLDDDADGQTDGRGPTADNPDPGCTSRDDTDETGEVAVSDDCRASSGVFGGANGAASAAAAINDPCPLVEQAWMTIAPGVATCLATSAANNYGCGPQFGLLHVTRQSGLADNRIDFFTINLAGPADCSKTPTIAIESPDGTMYELVEPWPASCGGGPTEPPEPLCSNGVDDDNDGQTDAPGAAGATDPDPGCTNAADQTENSEVALTDGCDVQMGFTGNDQRNTAFAASGCGELTGAWFSPSRTPQSCELTIGFGSDPVACGVIGTVASAGFDATTDDLFMRAPVAAAPACGAGLTAALRRSDGVVMEARGFWTC